MPVETQTRTNYLQSVTRSPSSLGVLTTKLLFFCLFPVNLPLVRSDVELVTYAASCRGGYSHAVNFFKLSTYKRMFRIAFTSDEILPIFRLFPSEWEVNMSDHLWKWTWKNWQFVEIYYISKWPKNFALYYIYNKNDNNECKKKKRVRCTFIYICPYWQMNSFPIENVLSRGLSKSKKAITETFPWNTFDDIFIFATGTSKWLTDTKPIQNRTAQERSFLEAMDYKRFKCVGKDYMMLVI